MRTLLSMLMLFAPLAAQADDRLARARAQLALAQAQAEANRARRRSPAPIIKPVTADSDDGIVLDLSALSRPAPAVPAVPFVQSSAVNPTTAPTAALSYSSSPAEVQNLGLTPTPALTAGSLGSTMTSSGYFD
jgi:hypothetical protein